MQCVEVGGVDYKSYGNKKHRRKNARGSCTILNIQKMLHLKKYK